MMLTEEITQTARQLGKALRTHQSVLAYIKARDLCIADPTASVLEQRMLDMFEDLITRQNRGEELQRSDIDAFNKLKSQVYRHPLIAERENTLQWVKTDFAGVADEINFPLGVEFPTLALA